MCQETATKFDNVLSISEFLSLGTRHTKLCKVGTVHKEKQFWIILIVLPINFESLNNKSSYSVINSIKPIILSITLTDVSILNLFANFTQTTVYNYVQPSNWHKISHVQLQHWRSERVNNLICLKKMKWISPKTYIYRTQNLKKVQYYGIHCSEF